MKFKYYLLLISSLFISIVHADDLLTVFKDAAKVDHDLKIAQDNLAIASAEKEETNAALLPHAEAQATTSHEHVSYRFPNIDIPYIAPYLPSEANFKQNLRGYDIGLEQPLINIHALMETATASLYIKQKAILYAKAAQALNYRVAESYFNVLKTHEKYKILTYKIKLLQQQKANIQGRLHLGMEASLAVVQLNAQLAGANAELFAARNDMTMAEEHLATLTKQHYLFLSKLKSPFETYPMKNSLNTWQLAVSKQNYDLNALRMGINLEHSLERSLDTVNLPSLNAKLIYEHASTLEPVLEKVSMNSAAALLELKVPLYDGGYNRSKIQATHITILRDEETEKKFEDDLLLKTTEIYNEINLLHEKLTADNSMTVAAQKELDVAQSNFQLGNIDALEILRAIQNQVAAKGQHINDIYDYLLLSLSLKDLAGTLDTTALMDINQFLTPKETIREVAVGKN